jgi:hypothetical protein
MSECKISTGSTDCISRQAVIDLMMQKWGENFSGDDAMQESIDAIRVMPSVTPQEPKIVPIAEIKYDKDKLKELVNKAVLTVIPQEPILNKIFSIVHPLSIMSTPELEHKAIMQIAEMLEPLCLPESEG